MSSSLAITFALLMTYVMAQDQDDSGGDLNKWVFITFAAICVFILVICIVIIIVASVRRTR